MARDIGKLSPPDSTESWFRPQEQLFAYSVTMSKEWAIFLAPLARSIGMYQILSFTRIQPSFYHSQSASIMCLGLSGNVIAPSAMTAQRRDADRIIRSSARMLVQEHARFYKKPPVPTEQKVPADCRVRRTLINRTQSGSDHSE